MGYRLFFLRDERDVEVVKELFSVLSGCVDNLVPGTWCVLVSENSKLTPEKISAFAMRDMCGFTVMQRKEESRGWFLLTGCSHMMKKFFDDIDVSNCCEWVWELKEREPIDLRTRVMVMGVVNVTPDSFYRESRGPTFSEAIKLAEKHIREGADIIDVGGESTRPGAKPVSAREEIKRVVPVIKELRQLWDGIISVDTYKAEVARAALDAGADVVNDISGMRFDEEMAEVVASYDAGAVVMHTSGRPEVMQQRTDYKNMLETVFGYIHESIDRLVSSGLQRTRIIVDPGIGFGKKPEHNLIILKHLEYFWALKRPILIGVSRKSFIGHFSGAAPEERLPGTIATSAVAVLHGARILRVHDVSEAVQIARIMEAMLKAGLPESYSSEDRGNVASQRI